MIEPPIDPETFIATVQPLLERQDLSGLLTTIKSLWSCDQIRELMRTRHTDAKKVALLAFGLVGPPKSVVDISRQLKDPDPVVNEMAEHAMWMIWFRSGTPPANHELGRGAQAIERREFEHAISHFDKAIDSCPDFAEAYNQRAIALYLMERYEESVQDCKRAIERMPCHFGALAGLGHCYSELGRRHDAIEAYQRALDVNPHMKCVRQTIEHLKNEA